MNGFTVVFVVILGASLAVRLWLGQRHLEHIRRHRASVPAAFRDRIGLAAHHKAADYTSAKVRFGRWDLGAETVVLLLWTLGGGLALLAEAWGSLGLSPVVTGTGVLTSLFVIAALVDLPFDAYRTFVIEERFGFNRTRPGLFLGDHLKQMALMVALGAPLSAAVLWTLHHAGDLWWLYAWGIWLAFNLFLVWAYPLFLAPLFNRFEPLTDGDVRARIEGLLTRNGLASDGIFVMDGSRRSGHGNAYFTGFGRGKRVVFFDTLLERLAADEVEAVLAHEVGHYKHRHIAQRLVVMAATSLAGLAVLGWLMGQDWFYAGLGVAQPSGHAALALFLLVLPVFTFFLQPVGAWLSRRHEYEADAFAAAQSDPRVLVQALVKLYQDNAATLTPDPLYSAFYDSHPPAPLRVAHLQARVQGA